MDREAWSATVHRVAKSQTGLKWLSTYTGLLCQRLIGHRCVGLFLGYFVPMIHISVFVESAVMFLFKFFNVFIWVLSLFIFASLDRDVLILFILSKNLLLVLLIIFIKVFYFLSDLYYFLPLTLGFVCSSFLILLNGRLGYLRFFFFFPLEGLVLLWTWLRTVFAASYWFCMAVFSLSFVSRYFLITFIDDPLVF